MKMLLAVDILTIIALAAGVGVLLTAATRRSHTLSLLLLFVALCAEITCAYAATGWLRSSEWEPYVRSAGRVAEFAGVVNLIRYLLPGGGHKTELPER